MIHNVNCSKQNQMIKPQKLFPLPQDNILKPKGPQSTLEELEKFKEIARKAGVDL